MRDLLLTICIPSYNRPEKAARCVEALLAQIDDPTVHIVVLDNGSAQHYRDVFANSPALNKAMANARVSVRRNPHNIGMSANFMRAFEIAEGRWLWLLSDDDEIRPQAVANVLKAIREQGETVGFIKFSSPRSQPNTDVLLLNSLEEFIDFNAASANAFNGFIFISNGIYRLADFRQLVSVGYSYANTYIPHFMMLTAYMASGQPIAVCRQQLIDYVVPEVGYSYGMVAGLGVGSPKHMLLKVGPAHYRKFVGLFFPHNDFKVIIDLFYQCRRDASTHVCQHLVATYLDYVRVARSWPRMRMLGLFACLVRFPWLMDALMSRAGKFSGLLDKHVREIKRRYA